MCACVPVQAFVLEMERLYEFYDLRGTRIGMRCWKLEKPKEKKRLEHVADTRFVKASISWCSAAGERTVLTIKINDGLIYLFVFFFFGEWSFRWIWRSLDTSVIVITAIGKDEARV